MKYVPTSAPSLSDPMFVEWLARELTAVAQSFTEFDNIRLVELNVAPTKPRAGMVVLADGTNWNPGSGAGFYGYYGGAWVKLG